MLESELVRLGNLVNSAEYLMGSYYFTPPATAAARRSYEDHYSENWIEWEEGGNSYRARYIVNCSCSNVYARGEYYKNGRKTTLTAIRNSYIRMIRDRRLMP